MTTRVFRPIFDDPPSQRAMRPIRLARNRNRVSRQLFGPVDHEETLKFFEIECGKERRVASETWDFDFREGRPKLATAKRYEWTKVSLSFAPRRPRTPEPEPDITELYAAPLPIGATEKEQNLDLDPDRNDDQNILKKVEDEEQVEKKDEEEERCENDKDLKSKQAKITG